MGVAELDRLQREAQARPRDADLWLRLAEALAQEDPERALLALRHAHGLAAEDPVLLLEVSTLYEQLDELGAAVNAARRAAYLDPGAIEASVRAGRLLVELGDHDAAVLTLRVAVAQNPREWALHLGLADALAAGGRLDEAARAAERALKEGADGAMAHRTVARIHGARGDREAQLTSLEVVVRLDPQDIASAIELGYLLAYEGRRREAVSLLMDTAARVPSDAELQLRLGSALAAARTFAPAVRHIREAIRIAPDYGWAHLELGRVLRQAGAHDEAIHSLRNAARLDSESADIQVELGEALRETGRLREASSVLIRAAAHHPEDDQLHDLLSETLAELDSDKRRSTIPTPMPQSPASPLPSPRPDGGFTSDLNLFSLPELLEFLLNQRATGLLRVRSQQGEGTLQIFEGDLVSAAHPRGKPLGERLVDDALVTLSDLEGAVTDPADLGRDTLVARVVLSRSLVDRPSLEEVVSQQILGALDEMVGWQDGSASFRRSPTPEHRPEITVDARWAMLEVMKARDEADRGLS